MGNTGVCGQITLVQYGALVSLVRSPLLKVFEVEHWCLWLDHPCSMVVDMKPWCLSPDHPCLVVLLKRSTDASVEASLLRVALILMTEHPCTGKALILITEHPCP